MDAFALAEAAVFGVEPASAVIVLDIDGTAVDGPFSPRVRLLKKRADKGGYKTVFLTARGHKYREETLRELEKYGLWTAGDTLHMTRTESEWRAPDARKWSVRAALLPRYEVLLNVGDQPFDFSGHTPAYTHGIVLDNVTKQARYIVQ